MLNRPEREPNFIEKKRQWKSRMEKPLSRRTLLMVLPALVLCVFVMLSAPYLKIIVEEVMKGGEELTVSPPLNLDEEERLEKAGPPPSPEQALREQYRRELEAEGFDWRAIPQVEGPDLGFAREQPIELAPVGVELPNTMTGLRAADEADPDAPAGEE